MKTMARVIVFDALTGDGENFARQIADSINRNSPCDVKSMVPILVEGTTKQIVLVLEVLK